MGDQPFINIDTMDAIIETWKKYPNSIIVPRYNGKTGCLPYSQAILSKS